VNPFLEHVLQSINVDYERSLVGEYSKDS